MHSHEAELLRLFDELKDLNLRARSDRKLRKNFHENIGNWLKNIKKKGYLNSYKNK